jgi:hypothetical protein
MTLPATNDAAVGTIAVTLKNTAGTALVTESYTAQVLSGPGLLGSGPMTGTTHAFTATGRAITVKAGEFVGIFPDGTSGTSKVEIRTAAGVLIGTETVIFHGAVASIVATLAKGVIGTSAADAVTAVAYDKDGTVVQSGTLYALSGTATVIASGGSCAISSGKATCSLTGLTAGTTAITIADASTTTAATVKSSSVSVRVGSSTPASILVATDKAAYAPGEAFTITVTVLDKDGLGVADGVYNNIFSSTGFTAAPFTYAAGVIDSSTVIVAGTSAAAGIGTRTGVIPSTEGNVTFKWTTGTNLATANQAVAGSVTVAVSSPGTSAATDAANEATDAANAATDAALAAAEAADAATTAAQEASDAVAALSETVTKLISDLQAQIKSLAAVVAKIAKKVKA